MLSLARCSSSIGPNIQKVTKAPTAMNVNSLTIDSVAMARIRPFWCSVASAWRVPNSTANIAIANVTISATSPITGCTMPRRQMAGAEHRLQRGGDRLQLQGDVGDRADQGDDGDGRRDRLALAVARGDEVGDRGDVVGLGQPHHAHQQRRAKADHQDRAGIDRQELDAGAAGEADRAEERPRRAVDRQRQRIDQHAGAAARAGWTRGRHSSRWRTAGRCSRRRLRSRPSLRASAAVPCACRCGLARTLAPDGFASDGIFAVGLMAVRGSKPAADVMPRSGIQYAAASHDRLLTLWDAGSPRSWDDAEYGRYCRPNDAVAYSAASGLAFSGRPSRSQTSTRASARRSISASS